VAVVIPCYRVKAQIADLLTRIGPECHRIYVVDDCCPDQTGAYVQQQCHDPRLTVLFSDRNSGVGGATILGYRKALADGMTIVVKIDGDGQMDPINIKRLIKAILRGEADYTKGNRFYALEMLQEMPIVRLVGNAALSFMSKLSSGYWSIFDPTNGYTAIHSRVLEILPLNKVHERYFFESDMLFRLNIARAVVVDVPMDAIYRGEKSNLKIRGIVHLFFSRHLANTLKRLFYSYVLRDFSLASIFILLAAPLILFGVTFGAIEWIMLVGAGRLASAGTVMLAALPIVLGVQFLVGFFAVDIANVPTRPIHPQLSEFQADSV
jgi:dolichol-phosphate mannosyltransferase